jgi:flagellar biosynthesis GTPase FlhF
MPLQCSREKEERERARKVQEEAARRQQQEARKRAEEEARRKRREEEERKRNEERERKQQEEDRKQRERTAETKKQKEQRLLQQSKPRAQMIEQRFDMLAKQWERLRKSNSQTLGVSSFPWPDTSSNAALGERVAFITAVDDQTAIKSKVNKALMRWHPDKFSQTFGALLKPGEQEAVFDKVKAAAQLANELRELYL